MKKKTKLPDLLNQINIASIDFNSAIEQVKAAYDSLVQENEHLRAKIREFNSETEIKRLNDALIDLRKRCLHELVGQEAESLKKFQNKHYKKCGSIPLIVTLTGTGIGEAIDVQCPICGEKLDITDVSEW